MEIKHTIEMGMMLLIMVNFSSEIMEGRKQRNDIFKMLMRGGGGTVNLEIYIQQNISQKWNNIKLFWARIKLREFIFRMGY